MTTDPIAAARALLEPLTGCTSGPWSKISAGSNSYHIGSGGWTVDASDPDGGYFEEYHICKTTGYYDAAGADARLMAASPDLRDMVATLADALEAGRAENQRLRATLSAITATDCYSRDECTAMALAALNPEDEP